MSRGRNKKYYLVDPKTYEIVKELSPSELRKEFGIPQETALLQFLAIHPMLNGLYITEKE